MAVYRNEDFQTLLLAMWIKLPNEPLGSTSTICPFWQQIQVRLGTQKVAIFGPELTVNVTFCVCVKYLQWVTML